MAAPRSAGFRLRERDQRVVLIRRSSTGSIGTVWRRMKELPLGYRLYALFWTLFVPAGVILVFAGAVVPGLVLLVLFVFDQAIFTPSG
jgi:hypothetical protein